MPPPQGVPARATWNAELERFEHGELGRRGQRHGEWRAWDEAGTLRETASWVDGLRHGVTRRFDAGGGLREEGAFETDQPVGVWRTFDELGRLEEEAEYLNGVRHGASRRSGRVGATVDVTTWQRGVREGLRRLGPVRGRYADDVPVGDWEYLGAHDVVLRTASVRVADEAQVLRTGDGPEALLALSTRLVSAGRLAEALVAAARAGGQQGDVSVFVSQLAANALPFTAPDAPALTATYVDETPSVRALLAGLVMGLHAPTLLRALAARLTELGRPRVALELLDAAVLLTPRDEVTREARALALLQVWLPELAAFDLPRLAPPARRRVEGLLALAGAPFAFPLAGAAPPSGLAARVPGAIAQPLPAIRAVLSRYAGRLERLRAALAGLVALPGLAALSPTTELPPEADLAVEGLDPLRCLLLAQADWAALAWLCWAVGLDEVALPTAVAPRLALGGAFAQCWEQCLALAPEAPADPLAEVRLRQALETLAMFRWLTKNGVTSPWQEDLREP